MEFFSIIGSILTGGATGLLGVGIKKLFGYLEQKENNKYKLAVLEAERENMRIEIEGVERVALIESETEQSVASYAALGESLKADQKRYTQRDSAWFVFVDVWRGLIRPGIASIGMATLIWFWFDAPELRPQILNTWLYITTVAVLWWFGERPDKSRLKS